jgi:hypothetical protein
MTGIFWQTPRQIILPVNTASPTSICQQAYDHMKKTPDHEEEGSSLNRDHRMLPLSKERPLIWK